MQELRGRDMIKNLLFLLTCLNSSINVLVNFAFLKKNNLQFQTNVQVWVITLLQNWKPLMIVFLYVYVRDITNSTLSYGKS